MSQGIDLQGISPQTEDAIIARLLQRLKPEIRDEILASLAPAEQQGVAEAAERHYWLHKHCEFGSPCNSR